MANSLDIDLYGKTVVFKVGSNYGVKPEYAETKFRVSGGFGANANTSGTALFGTFEDGEHTRMHGYGVRAVVEDDRPDSWYREQADKLEQAQIAKERAYLEAREARLKAEREARA